MSSISFTAGGIDVASIVSGLMQAERTPLTSIQLRKQTAQLQSDAIARLKSAVDTLKSQAAAIATGGVGKLASSVSNPSIVSASLSSTARAGAVSFTVDRLAQTHGLRTGSTVASSATAVTTAASLALSTTSKALGISAIGVGAGVTPANYTVTVSQATAGATVAGSSALGAATVIDGTKNAFEVEIDGVAKTITIADGVYSRTQLAAAVQAGITAQGGGATVTVDGSNRLQITTTHEGSDATLRITGGPGVIGAATLTALGLSETIPAAVGIDGTVTIGTNPPVTVTSARAGEVIAVPTGSGNLNLTLGGGLRMGDAKVAVVSTGDRSLAAVASAINSTNVGVSASAVKVSDGNWLLQLNSGRTGTAGSMTLDASLFAGVGGLVETSAAQDAQITIGSGIGAYSVTASGNSFTDVLQGVTLHASAVSATPITVSVSRDDAATADAIEKLVNQANTVISQVGIQTKYNTVTKSAAPLSGDSTVRRLAEDVRAAVTAVVGGSSQTLSATMGITTQRDGTLKFDRTIFTAALASDPDGAERLFNRHGSSAGGVSWAAASDETSPGTYAVEVTTAATRATTGDVLLGGSPLGQVIGVRVGSTTVTYDATAGSSATDIAAGLNSALAAAGLNVTAEVSGTGVRLTAVKFGTTGSFESNLDVNGAGSWLADTGTDVVGTINGEAAIGSGQRLSLLSLGTSPARGLAVDIDEGVTGVLTPVVYQPGIAARLVHLASNLLATNGGLSTSSNTYDKKVESYNNQVTRFEERMVKLEANYRRQWTAVQSMLSSLESQGNWLASQISSLPTNASN